MNLGNGEATQCYCGKRIGNIFDEKPLKLEAIGKNCTQAHCYNGHSWLTFGDIPQLKTPTYADMRNRITATGEEWLQPEIKAAFSCKLSNSNRKYSWWRKYKVDKKKE